MFFSDTFFVFLGIGQKLCKILTKKKKKSVRKKQKKVTKKTKSFWENKQIFFQKKLSSRLRGEIYFFSKQNEITNIFLKNKKASKLSVEKKRALLVLPTKKHLVYGLSLPR